MNTLKCTFLLFFMLISTITISAQTNLLDTDDEDYSFEDITINKYWPPYGEWGGSDTEGVGKFGSNSTSIRVTEGSTTPRTGNSYLFLRMRDFEPANSIDWMWRKLTNLTPGNTYIFSFWYKTPANDPLSFINSGNIRVGVVLNETDVPSISNPLNGETSFGYIAATPGVISSVDEHKEVSYKFTVPAGCTEVYVAWVRNGNQQPYLDDMSLVLDNATGYIEPQQSENIHVYFNSTQDYLHVDSSTEIQKVVIIDIVGRTLLTTQLDSNKSIDVSSLPTGNYLIKCIGEKNKTCKVIKSK